MLDSEVISDSLFVKGLVLVMLTALNFLLQKLDHLK